MTKEAASIWDSWRQYQETLMDTWNSSLSSPWSNKTKETRSEQGQEIWRQWWKAQEDLSRAWWDGQKNWPADKILFNPLSDPAKTAIRTYQDWLRSVQNNFSLCTPLVTDPAARNMMDRMTRSSQLYTSLASFWHDFLNGMTGAEKEVDRSKTLQKWQQDYYKIVSEFFNVGLPEGITEVIKKSGEVAVVFQQITINLFKPWMDSFPELQEEFFVALSGDRDAYLTFLKEWQETYHQSFGKLFHIPGIGPSGNINEKIVAGFDSYFTYASSLNDFLAAIYKTGLDAMEGLSGKMDDLRSQGRAPASFREFYDLWWKNNEDTYIKLFKTESFGRMLAEMVDAGARLKKTFDDIMINALSYWPIPTEKDMDGVYKSIHVLKSAHRTSTRKMEELLDRLSRLEERLNAREVGEVDA